MFKLFTIFARSLESHRVKEVRLLKNQGVTVVIGVCVIVALLSCSGEVVCRFTPNPIGTEDLAGSIISCGAGSCHRLFLSEHFHDYNLVGFSAAGKFLTAQGDKADFHEKIPLLAGLKESIQVNLIEENRWKMVLDGLVVTTEISLYSIVASVLVGAGICAMRLSRRRWQQVIARGTVNIIRRMPLLILLMLLLYVVFASFPVNPMVIAVIGFALYFGAYFSESFRTGIESVERGQWEAGHAMGFSPVATFTKIILPQALLRIIPIFKGLVITLIKSTSIVGYIAIFDMTKASDMIRSRTFDAFFPLLFTAALYLLLSWLAGRSLDIVHRRLTPKRRSVWERE